MLTVNDGALDRHRYGERHRQRAVRQARRSISAARTRTSRSGPRPDSAPRRSHSKPGSERRRRRDHQHGNRWRQRGPDRDERARGKRRQQRRHELLPGHQRDGHARRGFRGHGHRVESSRDWCRDDRGQRRVASRGGDLRRDDVALVCGRHARSDARGRQLHAALRQHSARRDRQRVDIDRRGGRVLQWRDRRGAHLERGAHAAADRRRDEQRDRLRDEPSRTLGSQREYRHHGCRQLRPLDQRHHHARDGRELHVDTRRVVHRLLEPRARCAGPELAGQRGVGRAHAGLAERLGVRRRLRQDDGHLLRPPEAGRGARIHARHASGYAVLLPVHHLRVDVHRADELDRGQSHADEHRVRLASG